MRQSSWTYKLDSFIRFSRKNGRIPSGNWLDAAVEERRVRRRVRRPAADVRKGPEPAREVVGDVVELLPADVGADAERMILEQLRGQVVDELMIGLIAIDREAAGVADDRSRRRNRAADESNDRRIVARLNVDVGRAQAETVAELSDDRVAEACASRSPRDSAARCPARVCSPMMTSSVSRNWCVHW